MLQKVYVCISNGSRFLKILIQGKVKRRKEMKRISIVLSIFFVGLLIFTAGKKAVEEKGPEFPPPPPYASVGVPDDAGVVKPVDIQPETPLKIAYIAMENNPFWIPVKEGVMKAREELKPYNTTVDWIVAGERHTADVFGPAIEAAIAQEYNAIATLAGDAGIAPYIDKATAAGVAVATYNSDIEKENTRVFFVGADSALQAEVCADTMAEAIGGKGEVAVITGFFSVEHHEVRRQVFINHLKENYPDIKIVGEVENLDKADVAYNQAMDFMTSYPNLDGIYVTAGGPFGAGNAVRDAGKAEDVKIVCYDFVEETMELINDGAIYGTVGQQPFAQGHDPVIRLYNYIVAGEVPKWGRLITRADMVTQENIDEFWSK